MRCERADFEVAAGNWAESALSQCQTKPELWPWPLEAVRQSRPWLIEYEA